MIIKNNKTAILLVSFITGGAVSAGFIGSQAYLLSSTEAIFALYTEVIAGTLFSIFVSKFKITHIKFSAIVLAIFALYIPLYLSLLLPIYTDLTRSILWVLIAAIGIALFRWTITELTVKHLNPVLAQSCFYSTVITFEFGAMAIVSLLNMFDLSHLQIIKLTSLLFILLAIIIVLQFYPSKNVEIILPRKQGESPHISKSIFITFFICYVILLFSLGAFKVSEDFLIKISLKEYLGSYDEIRDMMTAYYLAGSGLVIFISLMTGKLIYNRHLSPIFLISLHTGLMFVAGIMCLLYFSLPAFIAFEVLRRVSEKCFYNPAEHMIRGSFIADYRRSMHLALSFYYYTISAILLALLFTFFHDFSIEVQTQILIYVMIGFLCTSMIAVLFLRPNLIKTLYEFATPNNIEAAVPAIQALSYIRPKNYTEKIIHILEQNPHDILKKTVIMGLSYQQNEDSEKAIIKQFYSDKEDVQITVLDALNVSQNYSGIQFIVNILDTRIETQSVRVKLNAALIIAGIYGKKAIPFLLNGLDSKNQRIVANTLEVLSIFKDPKLIPIFKKFINSPNTRVTTNALLGLSYFRKTQPFYRQSIQDIFNGNQESLVASALYIIGKKQDKYFLRQLKQIYRTKSYSSSSTKTCLAWSLTQLNANEGYELFIELLISPLDEESNFMHLFLQLDKMSRFQIIEYFLTNKIESPSAPYRFIERLRDSAFNFQEELSYLEVMVLSMKKVKRF